MLLPLVPGRNGLIRKNSNESMNLTRWHNYCRSKCGTSSTFQKANERGREMRRASAILLIVILGCSSGALAGNGNNLETIESMQPHVIHLKLKLEELKVLAEKQVITRGLSSKISKVMAGFGAVLADATPGAFVEAYKTLDIFRQNQFIGSVGRFSESPTLSDLDGLTIDDKELYALLQAKPGDSDIKMSEQEITRIRAVVGQGARLTPQLKARLAAEYKKMLVERVKAYMAAGQQSMGVFADKDKPVDAREAFVSLAGEQKESDSNCPHLFSQLDSYPQGATPDSESLIYWAKQKFGDLKPVINIVHVLIHRDGDKVFIASKQIYSSHYTEAGLSVAELIPYKDNLGHPRTVIAYTIRLQVDMLGGTLGFMKKRVAQPRMLGALKESINGLRMNMEALCRDTNSSRAGL